LKSAGEFEGEVERYEGVNLGGALVRERGVREREREREEREDVFT